MLHNESTDMTDRKCLKAENKKKEVCFTAKKTITEKKEKIYIKNVSVTKVRLRTYFFMDFFVLLNLTPVGRCHRLFSPLLDFFLVSSKTEKKNTD